MNPKESSEIAVQTLLALRKEGDALRIITEKLRVKEMGPSDHIRTKHEVKAFVESGDAAMAEALVRHAQERHIVSQTLTVKSTQQLGEHIGM
jgi:hypothetical protein